MKIDSLQEDILQSLSEVKNQDLKNRAIVEVNWMIRSCSISSWHPNRRKLEMKTFFFKWSFPDLTYPGVLLSREVIPREKCRPLTQGLIHTAPSQSDSVSTCLAAVCTVLPQVDWKCEGDRRTRRRQKWTETQEKRILTTGRKKHVEEPMEKAMKDDGRVSQPGRNGGMEMIEGGGNQEYQHRVMENAPSIGWGRLCGWTMAGMSQYWHVKYLRHMGVLTAYSDSTLESLQPNLNQGTSSRAFLVGPEGNKHCYLIHVDQWLWRWVQRNSKIF